MTLPPLIAVLPAASVVRLVNAEFAPTAPEKVVAPEALTVRSWAPFSVEAKLTSVPVSTALAPSVTGPV